MHLIRAISPEVNVRWENVREPSAEGDAGPDNDEPPEAPPAGVHYVGDRVLVQRMWIAFSRAHVSASGIGEKRTDPVHGMR